MFDDLRLLATVLRLIPAAWAGRARREHADNGSFSTEAVVTTALLVGIAIAVMSVLGPKVLDKVRGIDLG